MYIKFWLIYTTILSHDLAWMCMPYDIGKHFKDYFFMFDVKNIHEHKDMHVYTMVVKLSNLWKLRTACIVIYCTTPGLLNKDTQIWVVNDSF